MIDRARKHARELGSAHARVKPAKLSFGFSDHPFVLLRGAELEKHLGVIDVPPKLLERRDALLETGALSRQRLRLLGIIPEARDERLFAQPVDFLF
jgi:hypothetical protein